MVGRPVELLFTLWFLAGHAAPSCESHALDASRSAGSSEDVSDLLQTDLNVQGLRIDAVAFQSHEGHTRREEELVKQERRQAREWLKIKFPSTSTNKAANYATSLLKFDDWIAAGRYNTSLFNGGRSTRSKLEAWPKIIHQTWKTKTIARPIFRESQSSWKTAFPSWEYRLWTDDEMMPFMQEHYPDFSDMFRMLPYTIMKVDAFRVFILHHYGGIYADLDFFALNNFEAFLETFPSKEVVVGRMGDEKVDMQKMKHMNKFGTIPNAFMVSRPRALLWEFVHGLLPIVLHTACLRRGHDHISAQHAYWKNIESRIDRLSQTLIGNVVGACYAEGVTGPALLTKAIDHSKFNNQSVAVANGAQFYPVDWSTQEGQKQRREFQAMAPELVLKKMQELFPGSSAGTVWTHSWNYKKFM